MPSLYSRWDGPPANMPSGGSNARSKAMAGIVGSYPSIIHSPQLEEWFGNGGKEP